MLSSRPYVAYPSGNGVPFLSPGARHVALLVYTQTPDIYKEDSHRDFCTPRGKPYKRRGSGSRYRRHTRAYEMEMLYRER